MARAKRVEGAAGTTVGAKGRAASGTRPPARRNAGPSNGRPAAPAARPRRKPSSPRAAATDVPAAAQAAPRRGASATTKGRSAAASSRRANGGARRAVAPEAGGSGAKPARRGGAAPARARRRGAGDLAPSYVAASEALATSEEERIESSKYIAADIPPRVFEEERFLFPESYSKNRVRLLIKDPEWLFAHWDVSSAAWAGLRDELGERALALSRLTLRVEDPRDGLLSVVLLPGGARSWYLRTHREHSRYRAELGLTTPSGTFRSLAKSNVVTTPRVGPSRARARRLARFGAKPGEAARAVPTEPAAMRTRRARRAAPVALIDGAQTRGSGLPERGGASDVFGPAGGRGISRGGASDVHRR